MEKQKKTQKVLITIFILILIGLAVYFIFIQGKPKPFIQIEQLYNKDGEPIQRGFNIKSIVGSIEGVKYMTLRITVENKDKIPLDLKVTDLSPDGIDYAIPIEEWHTAPGATVSWVTGKIDITPFEGVVQPFCAIVTAENVPILRKERELTGCIDIKIEPDLLIQDENQTIIVYNLSYKIQLDSNIGDSSINPSCTEEWVCIAWSACIDGKKTRTCTDINHCGTENSKPTTEMLCDDQIITFLTNAIGGYYRTNGVWIKLNDRQYFYGGYSSYRCLVKNFIISTPEGYPICTRDGYDVTQRVYLDDGRYGVIFKP